MYLILLAMLLSPLYLWRSGLPQISHMIAALAFGKRFIVNPKLLYFRKEWLSLIYFNVYSFLVAFVVYIIYADLQTLIAPIYYLFGFLVFLQIITVYLERERQFLTSIFWLHLLMLILITTISLLGIGRSEIHEGIRMMFAFNNPNQMANWTIWVVVILSVSARALYNSWIPGLLALVIAAVLINLSLSRAGFVGIFVLGVFYLGLVMYHLVIWIRKQLPINKSILFRFAILFIAVIIILSLIIFFANYFSHGLSAFGFFSSLINRVINTDINFELGIRAYDRLWHYPQYLIFGAGEGATFRFAEKSTIPVEWNIIYEVHSSWAGLIFNYGLVGFFLFALFLFFVIKRLNYLWFKLILLGPFIFGFSNYNIRNWYFWVGLAVVYSCSNFLQRKEGKICKPALLDLSDLILNWRENIINSVRNADICRRVD